MIIIDYRTWYNHYQSLYIYPIQSIGHDLCIWHYQYDSICMIIIYIYNYITMNGYQLPNIGIMIHKWHKSYKWCISPHSLTPQLLHPVLLPVACLSCEALRLGMVDFMENPVDDDWVKYPYDSRNPQMNITEITSEMLVSEVKTSVLGFLHRKKYPKLRS